MNQLPPREKLADVDERVPRRGWRDPRVEFRKGTYSHAGAPKNLKYLGLANPRAWQPHDADWQLPADWQQIILDGMKERLGTIPVLPALHGQLRAVRRVRRQVPLLPRVRRSEEHACPARGAPALRLQALLHQRRPAARRRGRRARPDRGRAQGVVLLLLPVHGMPPLLRLLPVRHRHRGGDDDRPGAAEPGGVQHQLGDRAGGEQRPDRQPPRHPAARLQGQHRVRGRRAGGADRHPGGRADQPEGRRGSAS